MSRLFLDTGFLIALEAEDDEHHLAARQHWNELMKAPPRLVTTTYIFDEVVTFFNSRNRHPKAVEIGQRLLRSPRISMVPVDAPLFGAGWRYFQDRPDKRYSLTDCISFIVMEQEGLREALSFDGHFNQAGFVRMPL
jgi:predicted nucleic acid-binding protein